jgi:DNA modification methylase
VRRVLRDDGTVWLNLGDSYAGGKQGRADHGSGDPTSRLGPAMDGLPGGTVMGPIAQRPVPDGYKPKDLLGIPWMVAFALRADGWYLRSDIIWAKPNPMPESVTDRPTKAHEYVFLLSKRPRYFYDADAIREDGAGRLDRGSNGSRGRLDDRPASGGWSGDFADAAGRNKRSVWQVATQPFPGAHFAVFPPRLIEPCVLAGSSDRACGVCGQAWQRVVERLVTVERGKARFPTGRSDKPYGKVPGSDTRGVPSRQVETVGWGPSCDHQDDTGSSVVLDPFCGAGTTGVVATRLNRSFVGVELNPEYAEMARQRIRDDAPLMNTVSEAA